MPFEKDDILKPMFRDNSMIEHIDYYFNDKGLMC